MLHELDKGKPQMVQAVPAFALHNENEPPRHDYVYPFLACRDFLHPFHHHHTPGCIGRTQKSYSEQWLLDNAPGLPALHFVSDSSYDDFEHTTYFGGGCSNHIASLLLLNQLPAPVESEGTKV